MNPITVPKCTLAPCGHPAFVFYSIERTQSEHYFKEYETPCPFCRALKLQNAIEAALIHVKAQCTHNIVDTGKCHACIRTILEEAVRRPPDG